MSLLDRTHVVIKRALTPLIYRYPPFALQPERLAVYLHGLLARKDLPGDVGEVGCHLGGTAAIAARMLRRQGWKNDYICYDTFGGFVPSQFEQDAKLGTDRHRRRMFAANSMALARDVLAYHDAAQVKLVAGDITQIKEELLSPAYSAVLIDVDLSEPTYGALKRFWPRLLSGGAIYVDDCPENYQWKARLGYQRFCDENGLVPTYQYGFGVVEKSTSTFRPNC